MDDVLIYSEAVADIADAIRAKTGRPAPMLPREMAGEIDSIDTDEAEAADIEWLSRTVKSVTFPEGITEIGSYVFDGCASLDIASLPETVTKVGACAFRRCSGLTLTRLPSALESIGDSAFYGCSELRLDALPSNIVSIGQGGWWTPAFGFCPKITIKRIPASVKELLGEGNGPFAGCTGLTSITFEGKPDTVVSGTFNGCSNLQTLNVPWAESEVAGAPWGATKATINYNYREADDGGNKAR